MNQDATTLLQALTKFESLANAAERGNAYASYMLGLALYKGVITKVNIEKAIEHLKTAADGGLAEAALLLGEIYSDKHTAVHDYFYSAYYYKMARRLGCAQASFVMAHDGDLRTWGELLADGEPDRKTLLLEAASADLPRAAWHLAILYMMEEVEFRDYDEGARWMEKAYALGHPMATEVMEMVRSTANKVKLLKATALICKMHYKYVDSEVFEYLGDCYAKGEGVAQNIEIAYACYFFGGAEGGDCNRKKEALEEEHPQLKFQHDPFYFRLDNMLEPDEKLPNNLYD
ncbi:MAG: tetratricopeptide repeat protein [Bacteroidales bacterium]|nr:tetratricopeptide repeat protein [Bacteroidales bacterium]